MPLSNHPLLRTDSYGKIFLYCTEHECACVPRHRIRLSAPIQPAFLLEAVKKALLRFPYLMLGIKATSTQYVYRLLTEDPVVLPFDGESRQYAIGSADTAGYLFLVGYHRDEIFMEYQHSISDGRGFEEFIRCVLFLYLQKCGYPVENDGTVRTPDTFYSTDESEDGYSRLAGSYSSAGIYQKPEALHADTLQNLQHTPEVVNEVVFAFDELRAVARQYEVSPLSIIAPLFCRAFYAKFGHGSSKPVIAQIPVDLRPYVPSRTNRYFICFLDLPYEAEYETLALPDVFRKTKDFLTHQMQAEKLLYRAKTASDNCTEMHKRDLPLAEKEQQARKMVQNFVQADSFMITNVGEFKLPASMHPYVLEYGAVLPTASRPFGMLISSYRGKMKISIAQRDSDLQVCTTFVQLLCQIGVEATFHSYPFVVTRFCAQKACPPS